MRCNQIKELLISDYCDNHCTADERRVIDTHLASCPACARFFADVQARAVLPFKGVSPIEPPRAVWEAIRTRITERADHTASPEVIPVWQWLWATIRTHEKPILALAATFCIIISALVITMGQMQSAQGVRAYVDNQARFLSSLGVGSTGDEAPGVDGFDSTIETFFM